jgi:Mg2+ and Co2+ transporter CorA
MNVAVPFADNQYAFAFVLAIVLGLSALAVLLFRKNKWL